MKVTAVSIAKEMKLPPKRVRAILRKAGMKHDGRWNFEASQKTKIKELVRQSRKRASVDKTAKAKAKAKTKTRGRKRPATEQAEQRVVMH